MAKIIDLKIQNNDWVSYFKLHRSYKKRLCDNKGHAELLDMLFDAIFVMGLKDYKPLEKKIDEVLSEKVWPSTE